MAASAPNGLTIGMVNVGGDIASLVEKQPGQSFNMAKLSWIGQPAQIPNALVTQPGSSVQSFSGMLHGGNVTVLDIRNGIGDMLNRVIYGAFSVPYKLDTGFEATSALKQGFLAKDGQTILEAMSTLYPLISGNEAKPLLVIGPVSLSSYQKVLGGVPTLQTEMSTAGLSGSKQAAVTEALALSNLSDDFAAPAGLPASELSTLRQAFAKAAALPALQAQAGKESLPLSFIGGATLSGQVNSALANSTRSPCTSTSRRLLLSTKTTTKVAHYHVQKQRRAEFIEAWRANQRTVVALEDVEMHDTERRMRRGVYVGADGGRPTRSMDATAHEIDPGRSARCTATRGTRWCSASRARPGPRSTGADRLGPG